VQDPESGEAYPATTVFGRGVLLASERMESVLLVGEISGTARATLADRDYAIRRVDEERPLTDGNGTIGEAGASRTDPADRGSAGDMERRIPDSARDASGAIVVASDGDRDAIRTLRTVAQELPILYAVGEGDSAAAGPALAAGADDRVLLDGERNGDRIASRLDGLLGKSVGPGTASAPVPGDGPPSLEQLDGHGGARDDRIGALLEGARDLMDADDADAVADVAVRTAEEALGYDTVGVLLVEDDGERLRLAASTGPAEAIYEEAGEMAAATDAVLAAIGQGRTLELDEGDLSDAANDALGSALLFPLGSHGVFTIGSAEPDAFGEADRHVGELLAANARTALDRIDRVERIEAIHGATREMLDARRPGEAAQRAVDAAKSILGYRFVVCFLADDETDRLEPVAWTDEAGTLTGGEIPTPDDDGALEAFETGAVVQRDGQEDGTTSGLPVTSRLHVPIEGHGTMLVSAPGGDGFDESDVQLARVLATNTARALDRVDRTQELRRLETVFETVDEMVYVQDETGNFLHCTPVLAERLGYDREELIGSNVTEFVDEEAAAEGQRLIEELLGEPLGSSRTQRLEIETADGESVPVEIDFSLLPGEEYRGVVAAVRDISDLLAVRERLDSQQNRFEYLFENIPDPVVEADLDGGEATVISVNTAFEETFGYSNEAIAGRSLNEAIVPEDGRDRARRLDASAAAGELNKAEVERETQYGRREFLFRGVPYGGDDGSVRGFGIYTDITDQKERERHLDVLQRLLRHNVRNDVNVMLAGIDQLDEALEDPDDTEAALLETLEESAEALLSMSTKAKRISRVIDAETEELDVVDLSSIARSVVERALDRDLDATVELDAPDRCRVLGSTAIERAVEELLGNAIQHAGPSPTVTLSIECEADRAGLTVTDDGSGIPEAERDVLKDGEITPLKHGSGLGLWLVTHATEASGGTVSFDDEADGARVTLSFRRSMGVE
jgi:PAS domain S-box-containing protein